MAHVLACSLQQVGGVWQRRAVEEADVDVCSEDIDRPERSVFHAHDGTAIVEKLSHVRAADAQAVEPLMGEVTEFTGPSREPRGH